MKYNKIILTKCVYLNCTTHYEGSISTCNNVDSGSISGVAISLPHVFQRFDCSSRANESDERFNYFTKHVSCCKSEYTEFSLFKIPYFH